jgi:hypothetical protein
MHLTRRPIEAPPQPEYLQVPDELLGSKPFTY